MDTRVCVIDWLDHYVDPASTAWVPVPDVTPAPIKVRTVGYVIKETDDIVTVAHTLHDGEAIGVFHILKDVIIQMKDINMPKLAANAVTKRPARVKNRRS